MIHVSVATVVRDLCDDVFVVDVDKLCISV